MNRTRRTPAQASYHRTVLMRQSLRKKQAKMEAKVKQHTKHQQEKEKYKAEMLILRLKRSETTKKSQICDEEIKAEEAKLEMTNIAAKLAKLIQEREKLKNEISTQKKLIQQKSKGKRKIDVDATHTENCANWSSKC